MLCLSRFPPPVGSPRDYIISLTDKVKSWQSDVNNSLTSVDNDIRRDLEARTAEAQNGLYVICIVFSFNYYYHMRRTHDLRYFIFYILNHHMKHSILIESVTKKLHKRTCNDIVVGAYWI